MNFLNPLFLLGLIAVALPLLIHLMNLRRPKTVRFSTLAFFESMKSDVLRRIQIKKWLLLSIRMAAILMLALALARPFISSGSSGEVAGMENQPRSIGIFMDNSPSMDEVDRYGPFMDQAKQIAGEIIGAARSEDRIFLDVSNGAPLELPALTPTAAGAQLQQLQPLNQGLFFRENMERLLYRLDSMDLPAGPLYLITDGQASQFMDLFETGITGAEDHTLHVFLVGEETRTNVAVTGVELEQDRVNPDEPIQLSVQVENFGESPVENQLLSLNQGGEIVGQRQLDLETGGVSVFDFEVVPTGDDSLTGFFYLEGDEVTFDNQYFFSLHLPEAKQVLRVRPEEIGSSRPSYLGSVLEASHSGSNLLEVEQVTAGDAIFTGETPDVIIFDGVESIPEYVLNDLVEFLQQGGGVLLLPSAEGDLQSFNRLLERTGFGRYSGVDGSYGSFNAVDRLATLRNGHPVLDDIFDRTDDEELRVNLPELFYRYQLELEEQSGLYRLLESEDGGVILAEQQVGEGLLMVSAIGADAGWSNFPVKPLFAPLFHRIVNYLAGGENARLLEHTLGNPFEYQLRFSPDDVIIQVEDRQIRPERESGFQGLYIREPARDWGTGFAEIITDQKNLVIALNQYTMESDFTALDQQELQDRLSGYFDQVLIDRISGDNLTESAGDVVAAGYGRELWFWFILAAIVLLLTESIVARLFKGESI